MSETNKTEGACPHGNSLSACLICKTEKVSTDIGQSINKEDFLKLKNENRIRIGAIDTELFLQRKDIEIAYETRTPEELAEYYSPWYFKIENGKHKPASYGKIIKGEEQGQAIKISDHDITTEVFGDKHSIKINSYKDSLQNPPNEPLILAEDLDTQKTLILDGNHTAKAIHLNYLDGINMSKIPVIVVRGHKLAEIFGDLNIINK